MVNLLIVNIIINIFHLTQISIGYVNYDNVDSEMHILRVVKTWKRVSDETKRNAIYTIYKNK